LQTIFNQDEAPQNVGPHLGYKMFDTRILYCHHFGWK